MNNNQKIAADRVIDYLHSMDIDGEVMEYIINGAHMTEQMLRQLVMKAPNEDLDNIIAERNSLKATKQTAVEWLIEQLKESGIPLMKDELEMIQQAKQMEKKQIMKSNGDGVDMAMDKKRFITSEQYYNETYGTTE